MSDDIFAIAFSIIILCIIGVLSFIIGFQCANWSKPLEIEIDGKNRTQLKNKLLYNDPHQTVKKKIIYNALIDGWIIQMRDNGSIVFKMPNINQSDWNESNFVRNYLG